MWNILKVFLSGLFNSVLGKYAILCGQVIAALLCACVIEGICFLKQF